MRVHKICIMHPVLVLFLIFRLLTLALVLIPLVHRSGIPRGIIYNKEIFYEVSYTLVQDTTHPPTRSGTILPLFFSYVVYLYTCTGIFYKNFNFLPPDTQQPHNNNSFSVY